MYTQICTIIDENVQLKITIIIKHFLNIHNNNNNFQRIIAGYRKILIFRYLPNIFTLPRIILLPIHTYNYI